MKLQGRILLFDEVNLNKDIFPTSCNITIPEKIPLTWDFKQDKVIGFAKATIDDIGITFIAETFSNDIIGVDNIRSIFENRKIGVGGFYTNVKYHKDGNFKIIDEARLFEIALVLDPVRKEYYCNIMEEENQENNEQ